MTYRPWYHHARATTSVVVLSCILGWTAIATATPSTASVANISNGDITYLRRTGPTETTATAFSVAPPATASSASDLPIRATATCLAWSPKDGSRLAYVTGDGELITVRSDGSDDFALTDPVANQGAPAARGCPSWSPDGTSIVFSDDAGNLQLSLANGSLTEPLSTAGSTAGRNPAWSPDGNTLAVNTAAGGLELLDLKALPSVPPRTTLVTGRPVNRYPAWSPNGSRLTVVSSPNTDGSAASIRSVSPVTGALLDTGPSLGDSAKIDYAPRWAPDGTAVVFTRPISGASGTQIVTTSAALGVLTVAASTSGSWVFTPTWRIVAPATTSTRLFGANRIDTAVSVSHSLWDSGTADAVILSRSDAFPDALAGVPLAAVKKGPLLLTPPTYLSTSTKTEIQRVLPAGHSVYLLGGTASLSSAIESQLQAMGYLTTRLGGANRYASAVAIANAITPTPATILVTTGTDFPDALAAGPAAAAPGVNGTLVLTNGGSVPADTAAYLAAHSGAKVFAIGGQAASARLGTDETLVGQNRYATAALVSAAFFNPPRRIGMANGVNFPDALSGGAAMATLGGPIVLSSPTSLSADTAFTLSANSASIDEILLFGGTAVLSETVRATAVAQSG
jgi:WD40 repeat protein